MSVAVVVRVAVAVDAVGEELGRAVIQLPLGHAMRRVRRLLAAVAPLNYVANDITDDGD